MKTLSCDLCDYEAQAETFESWMAAMKPHFASAHMDFMQEKMQLPPKEQQAQMQQWMTDNKARFDDA
jgi:hypothetical protein